MSVRAVIAMRSPVGLTGNHAADPEDLDIVVRSGQSSENERSPRRSHRAAGVRPDQRRHLAHLVRRPRPRIPRVAAEREALVGYLEYYRATVEMKCRGLTPEQTRIRTMPPSTMSLHGLVRHLAGVERWWFQQNFERRDVPLLFAGADGFEPPSDADFAADLAAWRAECSVSREIVAAHHLDDTVRPLDWYEDVDLRWLVLRMITEYAQHCGHIDLLREGVDGKTGV